MNIPAKILKSASIQLEPLNETHKQALYDAAQDESIWTHAPAKTFGEQFNHWFDEAMTAFKQAQRLPFAVRRLSDNQIIGSTSYYNIHLKHQRLTIGYTWYIPEVWGTSVNPECKLQLLSFAFEALNINRVEFMADARNLRSCAAIKKLGAMAEGVLRHHMVLHDGFIRDSAIFSIIKPDWETVKAALQLRCE